MLIEPQYVTTPKQEASWVKMRSVTEQPALDEFLATAELAGTDFTAEKMNNVKIIHRDQKNPYLLSAAEERATVRKQQANKKRLRIPRRPAWDEQTSKADLEERERQSLLDWRRGLAQLQDGDDLLMTPFERNLEVWRQLWRVIERSDLVVQIVDARNPLLFRCEDLEGYVKDVDPRKRNLLLVNKADMMTLEQRKAWARFFKSAGIRFRFFSAHLAREMAEAEIDVLDQDEENDKDEDEDEDKEDEGEGNNDDDDDDDEDGDSSEESESDQIAETAKRMRFKEAQEEDAEWTSEGSEDEGDAKDRPRRISVQPEDTRIITTEELETLFLQHAPKVETKEDDEQPRKATIGLVGYPNVGKSSTINALIGAKKVSVSATPGKTKHFQTIHLSERVILCDCPGLVFPNFANTKAELVCNGVLPIDQMREHTGPAGLVAQRIPKSFLEAIYGMKIETRPLEEGGTGVPTGEEVLRAYATARGFSTQGLGQPDESRAARHVFKDYVNGKLLFCHPPPSDPPIDPRHFNRELYNAAHLPERRRARFAADEDAELKQTSNGLLADDATIPLPSTEGVKGRGIDKKFFGAGSGHDGHLTLPLHQRLQEQATTSGKPLTGRKLKTTIALEKNVDPSDLRTSSKKHYKANKRRNQQDRKGYT